MEGLAPPRATGNMAQGPFISPRLGAKCGTVWVGEQAAGFVSFPGIMLRAFPVCQHLIRIREPRQQDPLGNQGARPASGWEGQVQAYRDAVPEHVPHCP